MRRIFIRRIQRAGFLLPSSLTLYVWLKGVHPDLPGMTCPLRALTGIPCPACFLTRATSEALQGDLVSSFDQHAFGPILAIGLLLWSIQAIRHRHFFPFSPRAFPIFIGTIFFFMYWLIRLSLTLSFGLRGFPAFP